MKDYIPLAIIAGLLAPATAANAQDYGAAPGKTRVTLYFEGSQPVARPTPAAVRVSADRDRAPSINTRDTVQAYRSEALPTLSASDGAPRSVRYMTAEEWARHPANTAKAN